jgi:hypothetical protein
VEPITALLTIGGAHGVSVLVKALSGSGELGQLSSELFRALTESESRIDSRLSTIEDLLDDLLEQPYSVALGDGVRHFLDAGITSAERATELDRARDKFITATSAARSPLQRAIAERYILLCLLAQDRLDLVPASVTLPLPHRESGGHQLIYAVTENPYWAFQARPGEPLWIGSLSVEFSPSDSEPAPRHPAAGVARAQALASLGRERPSHIAHVELDAPLSRAATIAAATADIRPNIEHI